MIHERQIFPSFLLIQVIFYKYESSKPLQMSKYKKKKKKRELCKKITIEVEKVENARCERAKDLVTGRPTRSYLKWTTMKIRDSMEPHGTGKD